MKEIKKELKDLEMILNATFNLTEQEALPMNEERAAVEQNEIQQERNMADIVR